MLERLLEIQETVDSSCLHERFDIENRLGDILEPMNLALLPILETISPSLPFEKPLRACILAIIWELVQRSSQTPFSVSRKVLCLLSSAAGYQATSPGVSSRHLFPTIIRSLSKITGLPDCSITSMSAKMPRDYPHSAFRVSHQVSSPGVLASSLYDRVLL